MGFESGGRGFIVIKSMTGYGRSTRLSPLGKWVVEIHSVNKRDLDCNIFLPKDLLRFDLEIRKIISSVCSRGQITVRVFFEPNPSEFGFEERLRYLTLLKEETEKMRRRLGYGEESIDFSFLYEQSKSAPVLPAPEEERKMEEELLIAFEEALGDWVEMKKAEGALLLPEFTNRLSTLQSLSEPFEGKKEELFERRKKKILDRLERFKSMGPEEEERVLRELFFHLEKGDVTEEIARLRSHIQQFTGLLQSREKAVGKTLDFLVREMGREANTISAKVDDPEMTSLSLQMKGEVEKIREQVQNIE